jgi:tRNA pseudouridine55 synthase
MPDTRNHAFKNLECYDGMQGVLLVDKEEGESSFGAVKKVKGILGVKKAGHAGSLDPFATGLLVVLLGQGTKLSRFLMAGRKRYLATLRLGSETDTLDLTGKIVRERPVKDFSLLEVREKAGAFLGDVEQIPPSFSAVKYKGTRAYKLARRGIRVELKKRTVSVHQLEILCLNLPEVTLVVECSGGTYVRSLAADLGEALGTGAHLRSLRRLSSGPFTLEEAVRIGDLPCDDAALRSRIIPLSDALPDVREQAVDEETARRIRSGCRPGLEALTATACPGEGPVKLVKGSDLVALAEFVKGRGETGKQVRLLRVFH